MSGLVPQTESHLPGSGGCGRGTERVEDSAGSGESGLSCLNLGQSVLSWYLQLDQTQKLVQQLSSQLADLRDQMTEQRKHKQRMGLLNSAPSLINIGDRH